MSDATPVAYTAHDLFEHPLTWSDLAGGQPIELEIGSGKGLFLSNAASAKQQHYFIGVELSGKFANRAAERIGKAGLANARMLREMLKRFY